MVSFAFAGTYRSIAVVTLRTVYTAVKLLTSFAKTAVVTKCTHTAFAKPALTAKSFLVGIVTVITSKTVPSVVDVAVLAGHAVTAPNDVC